MTLEELTREERELEFPHFDANLAWQLGSSIRAELIERGLDAAVDISRGCQTIFFFATDGANADLTHWIQRKRATVLRFGRSTLAESVAAKESGYEFHERFRVPREGFLAGAGGFPLRVRGAGMIGVVTVSGLRGSQDHDLIVRHVRYVLAEII